MGQEAQAGCRTSSKDPLAVGGDGVLPPRVQAPGLPDTRQDATGCSMALISAAASLFSILCESHVFFANRVTKVINRGDLGPPCVTSRHPHSLLFWILPFCNSSR